MTGLPHVLWFLLWLAATLAAAAEGARLLIMLAVLLGLRRRSA